MEILETLNQALLNNSPNGKGCHLDINTYQQMALMYSRIENAMVVLSDMQAGKSFIYGSALSRRLGLSLADHPTEIDSIWEEEIISRIHPEDRLKKYVHELRFFTYLQTIQFSEHAPCYVSSRIRMKDSIAEYMNVRHRMFYVYSPVNHHLRFALCLYHMENHMKDKLQNPEFLIVNSISGEIIYEDRLDYSHILTSREMEILKHIGEGYTSKEIAAQLCISINTVNRHRQNILEKLRVKNSIKAVYTQLP
ncbi:MULTISPECIES: response regulator transcription factor [Chryseobacterium]|uniref:DNA-binding CsgD family transcriptional regulator n=1 Tax=Chryseobacterium camelliae TaxID=1265445 RepID=A0ABU0TFV8_9FLAO|nr:MULTISPECIES: helix-turn-helix transcriptional regulator [Chryseobacterium]MDT3406250.1 DNA-binding CsgD family transcriptional regulator [Pseudacidovorax intermedius]MDQ1095951.1 DNA-binding CsgD family transcriptional regulator [Chryseobacterium camelliae]MDQ1099887.1 DNA-binding CsgD family transcriptional regulator [Chryseobacterium sp. SORGH_AS_1048]MDR6087233.1 DNA-binding CsgD family transcriptional regulator [Chryseobacterium sp. SORGH_AS_0909]MDR6131607.1 DNA-binding CsgD family tr